MIAVILSLNISLLYITSALKTGDPNVCSDSKTGEAICCFNYEIRNGTCSECGNGSTSVSGDTCKPCKGQKYGYQCFFTCNCNYLERCDRSFGCVNLIQTTEYNKRDTSVSVLQLPDITGIDRGGNGDRRNNKGNGVTKRDVIIYSISGCAIILGIGVTHIIRNCMQRRNRRRHSTENEMPSYVFDNTYDEIDETKVLKINVSQLLPLEENRNFHSSEIAETWSADFANKTEYLTPVYFDDDCNLKDSNHGDTVSQNYTVHSHQTNQNTPTINNATNDSKMLTENVPEKNTYSLTVLVHQRQPKN